MMVRSRERESEGWSGVLTVRAARSVEGKLSLREESLLGTYFSRSKYSGSYYRRAKRGTSVRDIRRKRNKVTRLVGEFLI